MAHDDRPLVPENQPEQAPPEGEEAPAIFSITHVDEKPAFSRRTFLEIAAVAAATATLSGGRATLAHAVTAEQTSPARAHEKAVTALAINAAGKLLASGDEGGTIKLWQLTEGALLGSWSGKGSAISSLFFPRVKDTLWSLDSSGKLKRWHIPDGKEISDGKTISGGQNNSLVLAVPNAAPWYAVPVDDRDAGDVRPPSSAVELRDQATGSVVLTLRGSVSVTHLASGSKGGVLFASGGQGSVALWDLVAETLGVQLAKSGTAAVSALAVDPDGKVALSAHNDGKLRTWEIPGLQAGTVYESSLGPPTSLAIRPQLDLFAAGSPKSEVGLWALGATAAPPTLLAGHTAAVRAVAITPDGSLLITGSDDKTIRLWALPDGKHLLNLMDLKSNYSSVKGAGYSGTDIFGRTVVFTLPCGSPIPPGAVCTCNCVPGTLAMPNNHSQSMNSQGVCTCDLICTCNTVCTCQGVGGGGYISYWYPN